MKFIIASITKTNVRALRAHENKKVSFDAAMNHKMREIRQGRDR